MCVTLACVFGLVGFLASVLSDLLSVIDHRASIVHLAVIQRCAHALAREVSNLSECFDHQIAHVATTSNNRYGAQMQTGGGWCWG
jgi:hypothetical protein